ncbi:flavin-dependent oxidoreductase [Glycomyces sp. A-F 0318]|uniref:flavin-dependent oxidoreductase n=1 Tax=Glycomyces amatae TaxID=2881355 RepID=UPI001E584C19|nr:flavin-dependent oxidoreductase [Glycomyces amatae]MCD0444092.1 flavin-dependent oxidoreductase [Glycomyces amatae]
MRIVIAGAGIGGLTAALSLHRAGHRDLTVLEAAPELRPLGVGLNILPSAVRELHALGLEGAVEAHAVPTAELAFYNRRGDLVWSEPRGRLAGHRFPQYSLHRGLLQRDLADAVAAETGPGTVRTGRPVTGYTRDGDRVRVHTPAGDLDADLLIGADGLHSAVRAAMRPGEPAPGTNGLMMWRGTTRARPFLTGASMTVLGDDRAKFVIYPIRPADETGLALVNWVTGRPADGPSAATTTAARKREVLAQFGDWKAPWVDIPGLIGAAEQIHEYPMLDRPPLPAWNDGPVTLLGDAAHPMYPVGSNGATQAIIDARALAWHLHTAPDAPTALRAYESERLPATRGVQEANRRMGPERVIDLAWQRAPQGFDRIEDVFSPEELQRISDEYASTAGFTVEELEGDSPYTCGPPGEAA